MSQYKECLFIAGLNLAERAALIVAIQHQSLCLYCLQLIVAQSNGYLWKPQLGMWIVNK